jgi:prepilin-type processing-associated H-X9-DG protein
VSRTRPDSEAVGGAPVPVSYGINNNALGVNASKFVSPSQLIIAAPVPIPGGQTVEFNTTSAVNPVLMLPSSPSQKEGTHNGRASINALFADTHVAQLQWVDYASVMTEDGRKRWFPTGEQPEQ